MGCTHDGMSCNYGLGDCNGWPDLYTTNAKCTGGEWLVMSAGCEACPAQQPTASAMCTHDGMSCNYGLGDCNGWPDLYTTNAKCTGGEWLVMSASCEACPAQQPTANTMCTHDGMSCNYGLGDCTGWPDLYTTNAKCTGGEWLVMSAGCEACPSQ